MAVDCDCCIHWKFFSLFKLFSRAVRFDISLFRAQWKAELQFTKSRMKSSILFLKIASAALFETRSNRSLNIHMSL